MEDIKAHLHERICDTVEGAENEWTWAEYIIWGYAALNDVISLESIEHILFKATNEELNIMIEELDWLLSK